MTGSREPSAHEAPGGAELWPLECSVNGRPVSETINPDMTLLDFLRDVLLLTGTKGACLEGECGSCTVIVDGQPINSCLTLAAQVQGREVVTIEGLARDEQLHALQKRFLETNAAQCGYCTPGLLMAAKAFLDANPEAREEEFLTAIEANICRCTGYASIMDAIRAAYEDTHP